MSNQLREAAKKLVHAVGTLQLDKVEPEMCCDAGAGGTITCGCYGRPINPEFYVVKALEGLRDILRSQGSGDLAHAVIGPALNLRAASGTPDEESTLRTGTVDHSVWIKATSDAPPGLRFYMDGTEFFPFGPEFFGSFKGLAAALPDAQKERE